MWESQMFGYNQLQKLGYVAVCYFQRNAAGDRDIVGNLLRGKALSDLLPDQSCHGVQWI